MKTVLFTPGFRDNMQSRDYRAVLQAIERKGYTTVFVPINWQRTTINDWVGQLEKVYGNYRPEETILAGFSYGSMTSLITASKRLPAELWLFSLSPYFAEDIPSLKRSWLRQITSIRVKAFKALPFENIYPTITCPVKIFAGERETPQLLHRFDEAAAKFKDCTSVIIPKMLHTIDTPAYIAAIEQAI